MGRNLQSWCTIVQLPIHNHKHNFHTKNKKHVFKLIVLGFHPTNLEIDDGDTVDGSEIR